MIYKVGVIHTIRNILLCTILGHKGSSVIIGRKDGCTIIEQYCYRCNKDLGATFKEGELD